jgi:hypothetical protein
VRRIDTAARTPSRSIGPGTGKCWRISAKRGFNGARRPE